MRIHQLPPAIANQIAAGEVIERPASVVKELLENSLDAGAKNIVVEVSYGGLNQIKISDNGSGINAEDLPLAVAAHATSKINTLDDLYAIGSMGFRGEALASIASVAKLTISSKPPYQEHAMVMHVVGSEMNIAPCARNVGTSIDVVDLFYNAPVRKRFLKSEKLEFQAIEMVVKRFALSAPDIAIVLKHNNKQIISLPAALSEQAKLARMGKIFGTAFMKDALYLDVELAGMSLCGWLSGPGHQRSQNDRQWVYVNQRMVKDKLINHALKQAYDGLLYPGRFPACLLYFTLNTAEVDVNVHPTKHEVRFQQPRLVHDFFTSQISKALHLNDAGGNARQYETIYCPTDEPADVHCESGMNDLKPILSETTRYSTATNLIKEKEVLAPEEPGKQSFNYTNTSLADTLDTGEPSRHFKTPTIQNSVYFSQMEHPWVILNNRFVLIFIQQIPYIVDIIELQGQWIREQLSRSELPLITRPLLVPVHYRFSSQTHYRTEELKQILAQLGLKIEFSEQNNVIIRSVPILLPHLDLNLFLDSVVELDNPEFNKLMNILCQSQVFDLKHLSNEERMELNQFLVNIQNQDNKLKNIYKALSIEDCRMLLHV